MDHSAASIAGALSRRQRGRWRVQPLQASSFTATWRALELQGSRGALFVKTLPLAKREVLEAEADGLLALQATQAVRVPAVADCWVDEDAAQALLALEWLDLALPDAGFGARLGHALGALHALAPAELEGRFGWRRDNFIGATPQVNAWSASGGRTGWIGFFGRARLSVMSARLDTRGGAEWRALRDAVAAVIEALPRFYADGHEPRASLIHGDLWSGNWGMLAEGAPVIYDPAVSVSDAEAELAMMELFGTPPPGFWPAYRTRMPVHEGYSRRRGLLQLYHLLNHAVLFGRSYAAQALALARQLAKPA